MNIELDKHLEKEINNLKSITDIISYLKTAVSIDNFEEKITAPILSSPIKRNKECYVLATVKNEDLSYISSCEQFHGSIYSALEIEETPKETHKYYGKDSFYSLVYLYNQASQNWGHPHITQTFANVIQYCNDSELVRELMIAHWTQNTVLPTHTDGDDGTKNYSLIINLKGHGMIKILDNVVSTKDKDGFIFNATDHVHSAWNENLEPWEFLVVRLHPDVFE